MRNRLVASAVAGLLVLALASCGGGEADNPASSTAADDSTSQATTAAAGNPDASVHFGFRLEPTGLDPFTTSGAALEQVAIGNVYESLVGRDENGELHPQLATEWEISDDQLTYTFTLREGVKFHDGSDFDAEDVVASLEAARGADSTNPDKARLAVVESVTSPEAGHVVVQLSQPNINILDALTSNAGLITASDNSTDLATQSNGTGPFTYGEWITGSTITLERNPDYWGDPAGVAEAVFHYFSDETAAANALSSGEIDVLTFGDAETVARFANDANYELSEGSETSWMTLGFNHQNELLADPNVRHAIRQAIDKDGLINTMGGQAVRVGSMVSPVDAWYDETLLEIDSYDPDAARELLASSGHEQISLNLRVADTYPTEIVEYVAAQLGEVGIDAQIETMQFSTWLTEVYQGGDYDMTIVLHVDPWTLTYYGNPDYYWNYDNTAVADKVGEALGSSTIDERNEHLGEVAQLVSQDAASEWLYSPITQIISIPEVTGYPTNRTGSQFVVAGVRVADE